MFVEQSFRLRASALQKHVLLVWAMCIAGKAKTFFVGKCNSMGECLLKEFHSVGGKSFGCIERGSFIDWRERGIQVIEIWIRE